MASINADVPARPGVRLGLFTPTKFASTLQGDYAWSVSGHEVMRYVSLSLPLALLCDVPSTIGQTYYLAAKAILYGMLLSRLFCGLPQILTFLMMVSVVGQDVVQTNEQQELGAYLAASIWQGRLGFIRPSWLLLIFYLAAFWKYPPRFIDKSVFRVALLFATVPFATAWMYGSFDSAQSFSELSSDVKRPLFLLATIILARNHLRSQPSFGGHLLSVLIGAALARHLLDCVYFGIGFGAMYGDVLRVSLDSTKGTVVFLFLLAQVLILRRKQFVLGGAIAIASGLLIVVYSTRGLWLAALIGLLIFCITLRPRNVISSATTMGVMAILAVLVLAYLSPDNIELATKRFGSKTLHGSDNFFEDQAPTRYIQILNAWDATCSRKSLLWGSGYGSYYTETVMRFPTGRGIKSAFPEHSIRTGKFYTLHHFVLKTIFKYGLIGFAGLAGLWFIAGWRCLLVTRNWPSALPSDLVVPLVAFLPTSMLELSWTSKGMVVSGFVIALCMTAYSSSVQRLRRSNSKNSLAI